MNEKEKCDVHDVELKNLEKEIVEIKETLKQIEQKYKINLEDVRKQVDNIEREFSKKIESVENSFVEQKIGLAEIRQEIKGIAEIKEMLKEYQTENTKLIKKMLTYFVLTVCVGLLFLIGMNVSDIASLFVK